MKEYVQKFKVWYASLELREQRAVKVGGTALAIAVFYFGIWSPFLGRVEALRKRIVTDQKTLVWAKQADQRIKELSGAASTASSQVMTPVALLSMLQDQILQSDLKDALKDMKQAANDSIQLQFKNVSFDRLMKMLMSVLQNSSVTITQFSAVAEKTPGMVDANILLGLSGSQSPQ